MSNTLLDVFVDVGARGIPQTEQDLQDFINRIGSAFGGLSQKAAGAVNAVGTATRAAASAAGATAKAAASSAASATAAEAKKAATEMLSEMKEAVLRFQQQKFEFQFEVRLLGDAAIRRQFSDLQSEVNAAKAAFSLAQTDKQQRDAKERVELASRELRLLQEQAQAARAAQGLAAPSLAAGDRERVFAEIKNDAAELNAELARTSRLVSQASDPQLKLTFSQTADEAKRVTQELNVAVRNKDFFSAETALQRLQSLREGIGDFRAQAERQIFLKIASSNAQEQFDAIIRQAQVVKAETQIKLRLVGSDDLNRAFADTNQLLEIQKVKYREADQASDLEGRIAAQAEILRLLREEFKAISDSADALAQARGLSGGDDIANQFREQLNAVEQLNLELKQTGKIAGEAKAPALTADFKALVQQAETLNLQLKQALDVGDLDLYKQLTAQLRSLQPQLQAIRGGAESQIEVNLNSARAREAFDGLLLQVAILKNQAKIDVDLTGDRDLNQQLTDTVRLVEILKVKFDQAEDAGNVFERVAAQQQLNNVLEEFVRIQTQAQATAAARGISSGGDRAAQFRAATEEVANFNLQLKQSGQIISQSKTPRLIDDFRIIQRQAELLNLQLKQALDLGDLAGYSTISAQLRALGTQIDAIQADAEDQIQLKIQVPDLKDEFKRVFGFLKFQLASGDLGSIKVLDATDREAAMRYRAEIAALSDEFGRLSARAELTSGDIARLQEIIEQLDSTRATTGPVAGLNHLQGKISGAAKSFNSLNNNAYQFGQLIEDAAIGYELNGIAGALRGAGNNASFLLQTFIASRVEANQLSFKAGLILTTLSAVGVAAAMMIIPRMQEWLETLDDIDLKIKNIADKLRQEFADVRLRVDLQLDQEAEIRALAEVEDLVDGIEAILRRAQEQADLQLKITAVLNEQSVQDLFTEATDATQQIADAAAQQIIALQARAQALASRAAAAGGRLPDFEQFLSADERNQIQQIEELQSAAEGFNQLRQQIFEDSKKGVIDPAAIEQARDALQTVIDSLEMLKGKLPEDEAKQLEENLAAAKDEMARLNEDAQKLQAIIDNDNRAFEALKESAKSVSDELQFLNEVNQGLIGEDERVLFDIEKQKQQFAEAAQELINLRGATDEVINALEDLAQKTMVEIVIEGEAELRKVAGQLDKLGEKFDDLNRQLGENAIRAAEKTANAQQKAAEKTADLQARLQEMARKKALELDRRIIESDIDALRSQLEELQPEGFSLGDRGAVIGGTGANQIENEITRLENQLKNMDRAEQDLQQANQIAEINKQIAETQQNLAKELKTIQEERIKADDEVVIEMKNLNDEMTRLREVQQRLEEAIRNFDPTRQMPNALPDAPAQAAEAAVMGSEWIQGVFDQLMQNTPQVPPGPWSAVNPNLPPQAGTGPQFRPEEPVFAPEDMPVLPDAEGMRTAQSRAMDAALSSADFKSSSLEGLIDQSNRLLSTLGDAVMKLDVTARYA